MYAGTASIKCVSGTRCDEVMNTAYGRVRTDYTNMTWWLLCVAQI